MELSVVRIENAEGLNVIIGQAHFIKTIEDLHEALVGSSPHLRFGVAFCEASGQRLVRRTGNDPALVELAVLNAQALGVGHSFVIFIEDGFPLNVLNAIEGVPLRYGLCATANPLEVVVGETELGRGILGVVDGSPPVGVESPEDETSARRALLRSIGYKL